MNLALVYESEDDQLCCTKSDDEFEEEINIYEYLSIQLQKEILINNISIELKKWKQKMRTNLRDIDKS